jgi:glycosyltransferase involved in cell wall biosynthesis
VKKIGYDAQAFLATNGGNGKGQHLNTLLGSFREKFFGFASTNPNPSELRLVQEGYASYTLWQQISLPLSLKRHGVEIFLAPYNTAPIRLWRHICLVLVLHDLILFESYRRVRYRERVLDAYRRLLIGPSVRRAKLVLTVSQYSRHEILKRFPGTDVRVIPCAVSSVWLDPKPLKERVGYLLMTTSSAPHKNAIGAIQAYGRYAKQAGTAARPLRIVGLGKQAKQYESVLRDSKVFELVTFLPFLSEAELIAEYQNAAALFFPSFSEGFGIPMLEAMATGTPILAANAGSLPEVGGIAARYFNPHSIEEMAAVLLQTLGNEAELERMAKEGILALQPFAPESVREKVDTLWRELADAAS